MRSIFSVFKLRTCLSPYVATCFLPTASKESPRQRELKLYFVVVIIQILELWSV
jgi:hypothetical protein